MVLKPLTMTLEKNMPIGSGLGSSACSIVAALDALNQFHASPLDETELLALMGKWKARSLAVFTMTTLLPAI